MSRNVWTRLLISKRKEELAKVKEAIRVCENLDRLHALMTRRDELKQELEKLKAR